jgi:hypothetical protein
MLTVAGKSSGRAHAKTLMVTNYAPCSVLSLLKWIVVVCLTAARGR